MNQQSQPTKKPYGVALLFIVLGLYLIFGKTLPEDTADPMFVKGVGIACVLFFGFIVIKHFTQK